MAKVELRAAVERLIVPGSTSALFADKVVLMEGITDALVSGELDRLAAKVSSAGNLNSFASSGWTVFGAHGTPSIPYAVDFFQKLGKKAIVLLDNDQNGNDTATDIKNKVPTFIYKKINGTDVELEQALLNGLDANLHGQIISSFQAYDKCSSCSDKNIANCLSQNCPISKNKYPKEEQRKSDFQKICLKRYQETKTFPRAFKSLLEQIDSAKPGDVIELEIESEQVSWLGTSREDILNSLEKVRLIKGEPGVGKTWFGCELAKYELDKPQRGVQPHQKILFLTFARNAVARIRQVFSEQNELDNADKKKIDERLKVDTFAGFFWWLVSSYSRYTKGGTNKRPWLIGSKEVENIIIPDGYEGFIFDKLESRAYETIKLPAISKLIGELYPLIIIDEFQDVHDSLFDIIAELFKHSHMVLLRGPGQCIYRNLKDFDPEEIRKKCIEQLKPEEHELQPEDDGKQRYCPEIRKLVDNYQNEKQLNLTDSFPVKLKLVKRDRSKTDDKGNTITIPNNLEVFANWEVSNIYKYLKQNNESKITIAVLVNTNLAVVQIHKEITKKRKASLYFKDELFLQYGRLILSLLPLFWIAKKRQNSVNIYEVLQSLVLLFQEKDPNEDYNVEIWKLLAETLAKKSKRFQKSQKANTWQEQLKSNIGTINDWLRKTKDKLKNELSLNGSTPFDKNEISLLDTLSNEFVNSIEYSTDISGKIDVNKAKKQFESTAQQRIIFEKLGIQKNVQVMTIHKSKGREFDGVAIVLEDKNGIWKSKDETKIEEIKELYNVAISRSKKAISIVAFEDSINEASEPVKRLLKISTNPV